MKAKAKVAADAESFYGGLGGSAAQLRRGESSVRAVKCPSLGCPLFPSSLHVVQIRKGAEHLNL